MAYYVGDIPAEDLVIEPARNGEAIDLTPFDSVVIELRDGDGMLVTTSGFIATIVQPDQIVVEWPGESVFATDGLYTLNLTLEHLTTGLRERLIPLYLVAQADDGWHSLDSARNEWANAPLDDYPLFAVLWMAKQQVLENAPALLEDQRPPMNYRQAQISQAENIWNSNQVDSSDGEVGIGSFALKPFPLDWMIKQMLRPKRGVPVVG